MGPYELICGLNKLTSRSTAATSVSVSNVWKTRFPRGGVVGRSEAIVLGQKCYGSDLLPHMI